MSEHNASSSGAPSIEDIYAESPHRAELIELFESAFKEFDPKNPTEWLSRNRALDYAFG